MRPSTFSALTLKFLELDITQEMEKTKEELELESIVFGDINTFNNNLESDEAASESEGSEEMPGDLFYVDTGADDGSDVSMNEQSSSDEEEDEPVWIDSDDDRMRINLSADRSKKLRHTQAETSLTAREYEKRLRSHFERLNPRPKWASPQVDLGEDESDNDDLAANPLGELLSQRSNYLSKLSKKLLPTTNLDIARVQDLNKQRRSKAAVQCLEFNPRHPLTLTAGYDRTLRVFHCDGKSNPLATSLHIRDSPFQTALFHPDGAKVFAGGRRKYMYIWDLETGSIEKITRLYGHSDTQQSMEKFVMSPDGQYLGLVGNNGWLNILSALNGQWITGAKIEGTIADAVWDNDNNVTIASTMGDIYNWDSTARKFSSRWKDQAGVGVTTMAKTSRWTAIGANNGMVNIYDNNSPLVAMENPEGSVLEPNFVIDNLVTTVSSLQFNHDGQILSVASRAQRDALRMVHVPSFSVFKNWPTSTTPLGRVTNLAFSPNSSFFAAGNEGGSVRLWTLGSYN